MCIDLLFKTWENNENIVNSEDAIVFSDDDDESDDGFELGETKLAAAGIETQWPLSKEEVEAIETVFTNLISKTKDLLNSATSVFDRPVGKKELLKRVNKGKSEDRLRNAMPLAEEYEQELMSSPPNAPKPMAELQRPRVREPVLAVDTATRSTRAELQVSLKSPLKERPHSANESLRSPAPTLADVDVKAALCGRLNSFSVLDTRFHSRASSAETPASPTPTKQPSASPRRNKFEMADDAEGSKPVLADRNRMSIFKSSTNFNELNR
jgi:type IV secretory pathway VirB10-like protein